MLQDLAQRELNKLTRKPGIQKNPKLLANFAVLPTDSLQYLKDILACEKKEKRSEKQKKQKRQEEIRSQTKQKTNTKKTKTPEEILEEEIQKNNEQYDKITQLNCLVHPKTQTIIQDTIAPFAPKKYHIFYVSSTKKAAALFSYDPFDIRSIIFTEDFLKWFVSNCYILDHINETEQIKHIFSVDVKTKNKYELYKIFLDNIRTIQDDFGMPPNLELEITSFDDLTQTLQTFLDYLLELHYYCSQKNTILLNLIKLMKLTCGDSDTIIYYEAQYAFYKVHLKEFENFINDIYIYKELDHETKPKYEFYWDLYNLYYKHKISFFSVNKIIKDFIQLVFLSNYDPFKRTFSHYYIYGSDSRPEGCSLEEGSGAI